MTTYADSEPPLQVRARAHAAHPAVDCVYTLLVALAAFERALLGSATAEPWSDGLLQRVRPRHDFVVKKACWSFH